MKFFFVWSSETVILIVEKRREDREMGLRESSLGVDDEIPTATLAIVLAIFAVTLFYWSCSFCEEDKSKDHNLGLRIDYKVDFGPLRVGSLVNLGWPSSSLSCICVYGLCMQCFMHFIVSGLRFWITKYLLIVLIIIFGHHTPA